MNKKEEWCGARLKMKVAVKFFSYISPKIPKFIKKDFLKTNIYKALRIQIKLFLAAGHRLRQL